MPIVIALAYNSAGQVTAVTIQRILKGERVDASIAFICRVAALNVDEC
jgi:hypothetical protein